MYERRRKQDASAKVTAKVQSRSGYGKGGEAAGDEWKGAGESRKEEDLEQGDYMEGEVVGMVASFGAALRAGADVLSAVGQLGVEGGEGNGGPLDRYEGVSAEGRRCTSRAADGGTCWDYIFVHDMICYAPMDCCRIFACPVQQSQRNGRSRTNNGSSRPADLRCIEPHGFHMSAEDLDIIY